MCIQGFMISDKWYDRDDTDWDGHTICRSSQSWGDSICECLQMLGEFQSSDNFNNCYQMTNFLFTID